MLRYSALIIALAVAQLSFAQCKTYFIGVKGDTLNCTDPGGLKQGKWVIKTPPLRGEPGFEEEGEFKDNKKEGYWRRYSEQGDILAIENYKYGYKNGISQYYSLQGLIREESWRAVNPEYPYDTVRVYDLKNADKYDLRIVKVEGTSYKQGTWKYYDPQTGLITKTEDYIMDKKVDPFTGRNQDAAAVTSDTSAVAKKKVDKPAEVLQYEKKNTNKKKIKVRDGATGY
jgi:hypothetical protein